MTSDSAKLAMIQMRVKGGAREHNLRHAVELIRDAATQEADIALLPECLDLGWTHPSSVQFADEIPDGFAYQELQRSAAENMIYICAGLTERYGDKVFNSAVLIDKQGKLALRHRKINELDIGRDFYSLGSSLNVVDTPFGRIGLMICADGFVDNLVISRSLCRMGAEIILSPCAWAVEKNHDNDSDPYGKLWLESYSPVAREFSTTIVGVSNVGEITGGPWTERVCIGCSLAVGPDGKNIVQGPYGVEAETIIMIDVDPVVRDM